MDYPERNRYVYMAEARKIAKHNIKEWYAMRDFFEFTCAKCLGARGFVNISKDHIIPVSCGGSDGLENIQPLCAGCNTGKGEDFTDYRPKLAALLGKKIPNAYKKKFF